MEMLIRYEENLSRLRQNKSLKEAHPELEIYLSERLFDLYKFSQREMAFASNFVIKSRLCEFERDLTTVENILANSLEA